MSITRVPYYKCSGCSACVSICPKNAITMKPDKEGFLYPFVSKHDCIECGLCEKVCSNKKQFINSVISSYAAKHKSVKVLKKSSSGGMSKAFCDAILNKNGVVYGVKYNEQLKVEVGRASSEKECDAFYGSKYVQADPLDSFLMIRDDLLQKKAVLVIGTSCYIAGLLSFLNERATNVDNLYTVDLICHGVPSPRLFNDYVNFLGRKKEVESFSFRTKKLPWGYGSKNFGCTIKYKNNKEEFNTARSWAFLVLFFSNNCLRPACHYCDYAGIDKPSDLTIADYWGCDKQEPGFFDENGVSAVIAHTEKGKLFFESCTSINYIPSAIEKITVKQGNLTTPSPVGKNRKDFWELYYSKGFNYVVKEYGGMNLRGRLRRTKAYEIYASVKKMMQTNKTN